MPGEIHNYWLGIMAVSFVLAMTLWIGLVFYANRHPGGNAQESWPHRDVMGGSFEARQGGRQVMPDPTSPPEPQPEPAPESGPEPGPGPEPEATVPAAPKPAPPMPAPRESPESEPTKADR